MTFHRRILPHLQRDNKAHFITFVTKNRCILPDWARDVLENPVRRGLVSDWNQYRWLWQEPQTNHSGADAVVCTNHVGTDAPVCPRALARRDDAG
jgi:hypothetical protein